MKDYNKLELIKEGVCSSLGKAALFIFNKNQKKFIPSQKFVHKSKLLGFDWSFAKHSANLADFLKQFSREIKWGHQRFWRGYDDTTFWDFDSYLDELLMIAIEWYIKNRHGSPVLDGHTENDCHEHWTEELNKMLHYFEQSDDRWCTEKNEYEEIVDLSFVEASKDDKGYTTMEHKDKSPEAEALRDKWSEREREIEAYKEENHKKGVEMLAKYYHHFWD